MAELNRKFIVSEANQIERVVSVPRVKAFGFDYMDSDGVVMAETASKARYRIYLACKDAGYKPELPKIRVWRLPDFDNGKTKIGPAIPGVCYGAEYMVRGKH